MNLEIIQELVDELEIATRKAVIKLKEDYDENYYYFSLITNGSGSCPYLAAWSYEALEREVLNPNPNPMLKLYADTEKAREMLKSYADPEKERDILKWSYADSPYYAYGEEYYKKVEEILYKKRAYLLDVNLDDNEYEKEICLRLNSMEKVMSNLDKEGLFGTGSERLRVVINAEIMPPEHSNTERALRLNPIEALKTWLAEAAE